MSQRQQWDRDAQPAPAWAKNLVQRVYLIEEIGEGDEPEAEPIFETSLPCEVGDIIPIPPSVLAPRAGPGTWRVVAREAAAAPYTARLIVASARP